MTLFIWQGMALPHKAVAQRHALRKPMTIAITGASGFIGRRLMEKLGADGRAVSLRGNLDGIAGADAVVHLAGEPVSQRWTKEAREKIRSSRVDGTRRLVDAMRSNPPKVLVSASAVGYYGSRGDELLTESSPPAEGFLADICIEWEREARKAEEFGVRVVCLRNGLVLGKGGGLDKMLLPFKLGVGGRIGDGRQWMAWIHLEDAVGLIELALSSSIEGRNERDRTQSGDQRRVHEGIGRRASSSGDFSRPEIRPAPDFRRHGADRLRQPACASGGGDQGWIPVPVSHAKGGASLIFCADAAWFGSHKISGLPIAWFTQRLQTNIASLRRFRY